MKSFVWAAVFLSTSCFAQKIPNTFWSNRCDIDTDGTGKSVGLKIKIKYPCEWSQADGDRPHVLKKFSYSLGSGKSVAQILTIKKLSSVPTKEEVAEMLTQKGLKQLVSSTGTFISGRKVKIDGIDCGEILIKTKRETPVSEINMYVLQYYLVYKDKLLNLAFASSAITEIEAKELFNNYNILFRDLATHTVILSKWE